MNAKQAAARAQETSETHFAEQRRILSNCFNREHIKERVDAYIDASVEAGNTSSSFTGILCAIENELRIELGEKLGSAGYFSLDDMHVNTSSIDGELYYVYELNESEKKIIRDIAKQYLQDQGFTIDEKTNVVSWKTSADSETQPLTLANKPRETQVVTGLAVAIFVLFLLVSWFQTH